MKQRYLTAGAIIALSIAVFAALHGSRIQEGAPSTSASPASVATTTSADSAREAPGAHASIKVQEATYAVMTAEPLTVLAAMNAAKADGLRFTGESYPSLGYFIKTLNGTENADGYYWVFYINGVSSQLGVTHAMIEPGDTVEWKYEKAY